MRLAKAVALDLLRLFQVISFIETITKKNIKNQSIDRYLSQTVEVLQGNFTTCWKIK